MVYFTVKEIKKQLHIHVKFDSFHAFEEQFVHRLAPLSHESALSAFFYLPKLSDEEALSFFALCEKVGIRLLGINYTAENETFLMHYQEGNIRSGQQLRVENPLLLFGSIRQSAEVTSSCSLSVFGEVSGVIDLSRVDCVLYAACLKAARIRIADSLFEEFDQKGPCKVFYEDQQLKCVASI